MLERFDVAEPFTDNFSHLFSPLFRVLVQEDLDDVALLGLVLEALFPEFFKRIVQGEMVSEGCDDQSLVLFLSAEDPGFLEPFC